jgi:hypothetical protein
MLSLEQAEAWGKWLAYAYPRLMDTDRNGVVIAQHIQEFHKGVWSEFAVRDAIFRSTRLLQWTPEDIHVEDPRVVLARQQAEAAKKVADAEAAKAAAEAARVRAEKKKARDEQEWRDTHADILGKSRRNSQDEHVERENQRIDDAKKTMQAVNEIVSAGLRREIDATINNYTKSNPVTGHLDHSGTAKLRAELRSISVKANGVDDLPRTLSMVRAAIKRLP